MSEHELNGVEALIKGLRIEGVSSTKYGNAFLERYNAQFSKAPAKPNHTNRALTISLDRLAEVFCPHGKCYVTGDLTLQYDSKRNRL